ncbi:MAG: hypothetical protein A3C93_00475 [Candidatus Lloydbacteria bacterium RIFCSPHIGHO2_02_FULL_54_17]|uniref:2TM domain-containing protein n=1 Tax=Candidatus Lloydbacteria bacterium RIFCSPHIGHO2_02_FULL_54_17 TaxID=1798664 RepID=A0A1G2DFX9_9BACT|nr:MAG: hypothetical protein A3C93_00475 [Candidatus Lloydbacteria bacterium RIFCSPHIGHO2_02_FULL_54_17]OGZ14118.1 MAG: hypothetical protein A2948_03315 [Candidatus Lloydbacteria bacterium RIFCSPLOWO2_01_FULL_54_18]
MDHLQFTEWDKKRRLELDRIWSKFHDEDEAMRRTARLARIFMFAVILVLGTIVVLSDGKPNDSPYVWFFFGSAAVFLCCAAKLFGWYAAAERRLLEEFHQKYGDEWRRLEEKEDADYRAQNGKDPFL